MASYTAFATAAATPVAPNSPIPFAPSGPDLVSTSSTKARRPRYVSVAVMRDLILLHGFTQTGRSWAPLIAEVQGGLQIDSGEAQRNAALAGAGIVYLPLELVREDIEAGRLVPVLAGWSTLTLPIHILYPSRRFVPPRVMALMDAIALGVK